MTRYLLIIIVLFVSTCCTAQVKKGKKKTITRTARSAQPVAKKDSLGYAEKRKIKYLFQDEYYIVVFFDNGKAAMTNDFALCQENLFMLYQIPSPYVYEMVQTKEPMIGYWKNNETGTGLKLSNSGWIIKEFKLVKEIRACKQEEVRLSEAPQKTTMPARETNDN